MVKLQVIGGGRMGEALVAGLVDSGWASASELCVVEKLGSRRDQLATAIRGLVVTAEPTVAEGHVIAVKPGDVASVCRGLVELGVAGSRVLSIAAGVTIATLETHLGDGVPVIRAMPNTPALIGAGAAAIAAGTAAGEQDLEWAESVLGAVGVVVRVDEPLLDAVTGLSGSGPAYVFLVAEALVEAGVFVGLPRDVSEALAVQTVLGSARMLAETGESATALRANVTSPGGTTAAGLYALEAAGMRAALLAAVKAAADRSRELGQ
ncbi:MAG: pyrroline-5-carboxylate reductase [Acidimicrobiales bacterium]|nr:pyrroline-5-carboxylate reductase [Acidimicrobiales bacterium]